MSWAIGFDSTWRRDIGYGVPAFCDHPYCRAEIDRGLAHVCGDEPYGGEEGCGLYFCAQHRRHTKHGKAVCERCGRGSYPFHLSGEHPDWVKHKLTDDSWAAWRADNPAEVARLQQLQAG